MSCVLFRLWALSESIQISFFLISSCLSFSLHHANLPLFAALQGPTSYHVMQISSFTNSTWTENRGSGWLEDLQIHRWDSETGTAIFLKPWSKGNLSDEEITELVELFRVYFFGLVRELRDHVTEFQMKCESSLLPWGCCLTVSAFLAPYGLFSLLSPIPNLTHTPLYCSFSWCVHTSPKQSRSFLWESKLSPLSPIQTRLCEIQ